MKQTKQTTDGTSFFGHTIALTKNSLQVLTACRPYHYGDPNAKVQYEWEMETNSGEVFTIYDWKEYRLIGGDEVIEWHIGALSSRVATDALYEIETAIAQLD